MFLFFFVWSVFHFLGFFFLSTQQTPPAPQCALGRLPELKWKQSWNESSLNVPWNILPCLLLPSRLLPIVNVIQREQRSFIFTGFGERRDCRLQLFADCSLRGVWQSVSATTFLIQWIMYGHPRYVLHTVLLMPWSKCKPSFCTLTRGTKTILPLPGMVTRMCLLAPSATDTPKQHSTLTPKGQVALNGAPTS